MEGPSLRRSASNSPTVQNASFPDRDPVGTPLAQPGTEQVPIGTRGAKAGRGPGGARRGQIQCPEPRGEGAVPRARTRGVWNAAPVTAQPWDPTSGHPPGSGLPGLSTGHGDRTRSPWAALGPAGYWQAAPASAQLLLSNEGHPQTRSVSRGYSLRDGSTDPPPVCPAGPAPRQGPNPRPPRSAPPHPPGDEKGALCPQSRVPERPALPRCLPPRPLGF